MKKILIFIVIAIALIGCNDTPCDPAPKAVIEGWIDSDGFPVVMFTSSLTPADAGGNVADMMIRWGKVTISDGSRTEILTGGLSNDFFPPYRYYSYKMKGVPGRTYTIVAEYENLHAEAVCTMPFPTRIDSVRFASIENDDTLRSAMLYFTSPEDSPAYYCVEIRDSLRSGRPYPALFGTVEALDPLKKMTVPIYRPKHKLDTIEFVPQFRVGERLEVGLCRVEKEVYEFWKSYQDNIVFGGSGFIGTSQPLIGNIIGGYGVWSARGLDKVFVEVP